MGTREILDHQFLVAAYAVTWILQLGYLVWLGAKWQAQKRAANKRR
jgi:CcmD family protein